MINGHDKRLAHRFQRSEEKIKDFSLNPNLDLSNKMESYDALLYRRAYIGVLAELDTG